MSRALCEAFRARSRSVWRLIRRGQSAGIRAAEETLTNLTLLELSLVRDPGLVVRGFSKAEERVRGADWEMWLGGRAGFWLGLRLQAKAIDLRSSEFRHLHYRAPRAALFQSDALIQSALGSHPPRVPLYVLYTYAPRGRLTTWPCGSYPRDTSQFGCAIVSAFQVQVLRLKGFRRSLRDLSSHMFPWHCLVCCRAFSNGSMAERARRYLAGTVIRGDATLGVGERAPQQQEREGVLGADEFGRLFQLYQGAPVTDTPPEYVTTIAAGREAELPTDLSAVLVMREN